MVPWTSSRLGDLNFDAPVAGASLATFLGSNQIAAGRRLGSSAASTSSVVSATAAAGPACGRSSAAGAAGWWLEKVSDSL